MSHRPLPRSPSSPRLAPQRSLGLPQGLCSRLSTARALRGASQLELQRPQIILLQCVCVSHVRRGVQASAFRTVSDLCATMSICLVYAYINVHMDKERGYVVHDFPRPTVLFRG